MQEIKPKIVNGEPVCDMECHHGQDDMNDIPDCSQAGFGEICIPGLRQQRDEARRELCETEMDGAIDADDIIRSRATARGWGYLYDK